MSLTWHLRHHKDSDVGDFLQQEFLHVTSLTKRINQQLRALDTLLPFVPVSTYRTLEKTIYYRIGYGFAHTTTRDLYAWPAASHVAWRVEEICPRDFSSIFEQFFRQLESTLALLQPAGRHLDAESEQILARYCFVLGLIEEIFRTKSYGRCPLINPAYKKCVDDLLAIPLQGWIDDLIKMFAQFYAQYSILLFSPSIINPTFLGHKDLGKESADLIVDRCLIEIKTSCEPKIPAAWVRLLAGSVLLDFDDEYHIHSVGIYIARQGVFLSWPLEEFFTNSQEALVAMWLLFAKSFASVVRLNRCHSKANGWVPFYDAEAECDNLRLRKERIQLPVTSFSLIIGFLIL